jgi:hypothetical protein
MDGECFKFHSISFGELFQNLTIFCQPYIRGKAFDKTAVVHHSQDRPVEILSSICIGGIQRTGLFKVEVRAYVPEQLDYSSEADAAISARNQCAQRVWPFLNSLNR